MGAVAASHFCSFSLQKVICQLIKTYGLKDGAQGEIQDYGSEVTLKPYLTTRDHFSMSVFYINDTSQMGLGASLRMSMLSY